MSRASDDAAGLAVASSLNVDSRVFSQGLRNLSDGVSVTNIAEGALDGLTNIVLRLQELAEQGANGTLGHRQRAALDAEAQALSKEYFRIAQTTKFNGRKLFDGSVQGLLLQAGYGGNGALMASLGGKMGTGSFMSAINLGVSARAVDADLGDLNGDGILDIVSANDGGTVDVLIGNSDSTFRHPSHIALGAAPSSIAVEDVDRDGMLDVVSTSYNGGRASVLLGNGDGTFRAKADIEIPSGPGPLTFGDLNGDAVLDMVYADYAASAASVRLGNGDGSFRTAVEFATNTGPSNITLGDLNRDGILDIVSANYGASGDTVSVLLGNGNGTFRARTNYTTDAGALAVALGDVNGDAIEDIVTGNYTVSGGSGSVLVGNGDGTFKAKSSFYPGDSLQSLTLGDVNGDGTLDVLAANSGLYEKCVSVLLGNGDGTFNAKTDFGTGTGSASLALGDLNADGVLDIVAVSANLSVLFGRTREGVSPLLDFSLKTKADAKWTLELMKQKLTQLSQQRGVIGANQSRLSTAVANLQVERENYDAARSQITDADVAEESATLVRTQILQQAASAVLSQANQAPALALRLLSG